MTKIINKLSQAFFDYYGRNADRVEPITQAGSPRHYYRFFNDKTSIIGVYSNNTKETETFLYYSMVFKQLNLNTPEIYHVDKSGECYFIEDLGNTHLLDLVLFDLKTGKVSEGLISLYKKALSQLVVMQVEANKIIDYTKSYSIAEFDKTSIIFDLNYFKYYFLNRTEINYDEVALQRDFEMFADAVTNTDLKLFMFRDFQARNIMVRDNEVYFIDYQGGRRGAPQYDVASLLFQAKAQLPDDVKNNLLNYYIDELFNYFKFDTTDFVIKYILFVYLRIVQTLGAYGYRGLIEKKQHFIESIPLALKNLSEMLKSYDYINEYPELSNVLNQLSKSKCFDNLTYPEFTITIMSFSYKKGLPIDESGNGGGFVFDCRGIHNPGRYEEYKKLTGKDRQVIEFFKQNSDIDIFVQKAFSIVEPNIQNYIERNFNSLMISFGCTGGQHRSVYCAEELSKIIKSKFNVAFRVIHREQDF